jgi:hypothetical protein
MVSPTLHRLMVQARTTELRRAASESGRGTRRGWWPRRRRRPATPAAIGLELAVTIRYAFPDDERALVRLATLDSREAPSAPVLLAEVDGELWAALSLTDGAVVADPFRRTTALVELLGARANQLRAGGVAGRGRAGVPQSWRQQSVRRGGATTS